MRMHRRQGQLGDIFHVRDVALAQQLPRPVIGGRRRCRCGSRRGRPWREYSGSAGRWWARDPILSLVQIICIALVAGLGVSRRPLGPAHLTVA